MAAGATPPLRLYKLMLREAQKFADFNFRSYAVRRVRDGFRAAVPLSGPEVQAQLQVAQEQLALMRRQVTVGHLFNPGQRLSIEDWPGQKK